MATDREKFDEWVEEEQARFEKFADEVFYPDYDDLEANHQSLKDVVSKHGFDWWEGMPALRITDRDKATKWFEHALA